MKKKTKKSFLFFTKTRKAGFILPILFLCFLLISFFYALTNIKAQETIIPIETLQEAQKAKTAKGGTTLGFIGNQFVEALKWLLWVIFWLILEIAIFFASVGAGLLKWATSENFIGWSYTNQQNNEVIRIGLGITQGLVNMFLVLTLIYIALATILRLEQVFGGGHNTRRMMVAFIIVALLVNFAPVFVGVIIDGTNILMNYFFKSVTGGVDSFSKNMSNSAYILLANFDQGDDITTSFYRAIPILVMAIFLFILTFILITFTLVFLLRYFVIWILVILSPLAFASYVIPKAKAMIWDKWLNNLINWAFIGVTMSFFLFLSLEFIRIITIDTTIIQRVNVDFTGVTPSAAGVGNVPVENVKSEFEAVLPFFGALAFLILSILFGFTTSAMGASTILGFSKKQGRRVPSWAGKKAVKSAAKGAYRLADKPLRRAAGAATRAAESKYMPRFLKWAVPEAVRQYGEFKPAIEKARDKAKTYSPQTLARDILGTKSLLMGKPLADVEATGKLIQILDQGDSQAIFDTGKNIFGAKSDEELLQNRTFRRRMKNLINTAKLGGMHKSDILRKDPRLARLLAEPPTPENEQKEVQSIIEETRTQHTAKWEPQVFDDKYVLEPLLAKFTQERWEGLEQIKRGKDRALENIDNRFSEWADATVKTQQPGLYAQITSSNKEEREKGHKEAMNLYRENIKKNYGGDGYFKALENERFLSRGWRPPEYKPEEKRAKAIEAPPFEGVPPAPKKVKAEQPLQSVLKIIKVKKTAQQVKTIWQRIMPEREKKKKK